jgi:hypothetical protein
MTLTKSKPNGYHCVDFADTINANTGFIFGNNATFTVADGNERNCWTTSSIVAERVTLSGRQSQQWVFC